MRICFFDIDGTLIASGGAGQQAFAETFCQLFGVDQLSGEVPFAGRSDRAITMDLLEIHGCGTTAKDWERFHQEYTSRLPDALKESEGTVLPGVVNLIDQLQEAEGVEIGLLTGNVLAGAEAKLVHYNLWHHFAFGGYGDEHTDRSDIARSAVDAARRHLEVSSNDEVSGNGANGNDRFAVIGDTIHDIRCARAIGAYAVAVPTGLTPMEELLAAEPDLAIETLEEARPLVEWLMS